ncbi:MAG: 3-oxoacyl-ACP reductase FabG [Bacteroidetes bacterium]|nr:3-oxoacyl-ACP reductase FabG [Bacteroidota bacterium]
MKFALVTGGSRGIGRAICIKMADLGYNVLVNYKSNEEESKNTCLLVEKKGVKAISLKFDVSDKNQVQTVLGGFIETHPDYEIEVLINNAGIREDALLIWMKDEQWESVINTNLGGFYYVTKMVVTNMLLKKYGRIINIVSLSGLKGVPGQINYSAAKAGIIGATKALAQEIGRKGITVNAVAPGFIKTDMTEGLNEKELQLMIPLRRFGLPEEVAHVVGFLASKESAYITAEVISVNGGLYS